MTLLELVRLVRHNFLTIALCTILGGLIGAAYAYTRPQEFQSTSFGVVVGGSADSLGGASSGSALAQQRASAYASLMDTTAVWGRIVNDPEVQAAPGARSGAVEANVVGGTSMIRLIATSGTAEHSIILANAAMRALADEALRLESVNRSDTGEPVDPDSVVVRIVPYQQATGAGQLDTSSWPIALGGGLLAGLILGVAIAFVRKQLDVRVRTITDVEEMTGHSVLGTIPDTKELGQQRSAADPVKASQMGQAGEALRQLRTNLRYVNVDSPPRSVAVTSSNPGEGKSTVASNLARLMAGSGQRVILIDADLRKPVQHQVFQVDNAVGLTQVLAGSVTLGDAVTQTADPNLALLTSGRIPPNPSEILGSRRMRGLVEKLSEDYFVIIDVPPMLAVTDPGLVAAASDGAIVVTRVGKTYKEQLRLTAKLLRQVDADILGTVLHRAPRKAMGEVVYGVGYGASYDTYYGNYYSQENKAPDRPAVEVPVVQPTTEGDSARRLADH